MKKKRWIILLVAIVLTALVGWYLHAHNQCEKTVGSCGGTCDFKSVIKRNYQCRPLGAGGMRKIGDCNCWGDMCFCGSWD